MKLYVRSSKIQGMLSEVDDYSEMYYVVPQVLKSTKDGKSYVLYYPSESSGAEYYTSIDKYYATIDDGSTYIEKDYLDSLADDEGRAFRKFVSSLKVVTL